MTSSPLQDHISVHIRVTGGWTKSLFDYLSRKQTNDALDLEVGAKDIEINIDGPFGSSSQYALKEKQIILVGAGIGVAPMASLLQDIKLKKDSLKNRASGNYGASNEKAMDIGNLEKVHFFWLNRDPNCFQWFEELLMEIARTGNDTPKISVHTFTTQCIPKNDARTFMLWNGLEKMFKHQGLDPTTNLPFKTHWGRPNWDAIFDYYSNKYPGEILVYNHYL
ncbi:hypothetical protein PPL_00386 [Heterostelium album PN500]|uniref:Uncharacterized protein n=1 Tax=Heterostelium pallidum (strain ATCC 26659 / Pp 5 / PN500) TaxID=670386 RepID=D3AWB2_HETP5|nr:hypothetical protein PPL_00386 [Heterostelium album PN500]EFA86585.1 hypothetical protein PPL_00386 [Heterostelium album PN500]|eukprot:XP_020438690.1 hypothetical protein PPL_00386 [Heterostelium album PN500]